MKSPLRIYFQFLAFVFLLLNGGAVLAQVSSASAAKPASKPVERPEVITHFVDVVGHSPEAEVFYSKAKDALWEVYPQGDALKEALVAYITSGPDGPGLGFAGLALIPFHDPATIKPLLKRAMEKQLAPPTRWCFLNSAPYIAGMGDVMYMGEGKMDKEAREIVKGLTELSEEAKDGVGRIHAQTLRKMFDAGQKDKKVAQDPDFGLALWHQSAYVIGTLDLRDQALLDIFLDPKHGVVYRNVIEALCFVSNRDFLAALRGKAGNELKSEQERAAVEAARAWWQAYGKEHPSGEWIPAAVSGFRETGYQLEDDLRSPKTTAELLRALTAESDVYQYNAARLLNHIYGTNFDLERIFFAGKYAMSFLDPMGEVAQNKVQLREFWNKRLKAQ